MNGRYEYWVPLSAGAVSSRISGTNVIMLITASTQDSRRRSSEDNPITR